MEYLPEHGVLISIKNCGIFLIGESGVGKSETALQLIYQGATLICDDAPNFIIDKDNTTITGTCPDDFQGLIHIRDIGIINIRELLGQRYVKKQHKIDYIIELVKDNTQESTKIHLSTNDAIYHYQHKQSLISIPGIQIHISQNRNIPMLVQTAITQLSI